MATMTEEEKRRLRAVQDEIRRCGEPRTGEELKRLIDRVRAVAENKLREASGEPDPELEKKRELARLLDRWRKP